MFIGLAAVTFALAKFLAGETAMGLVTMVAGSLFLAALVWAGMNIASNKSFLVSLVATWVTSRVAIVLLFPRYLLTGDEQYFHGFVAKLHTALLSGNISALSNIYDYPVWLSRAFPLYLPLAFAFGSYDALAARYMNVLLGAAQLVILFFIAKTIAGSKVAKLTCLLFLIFPYHCVNVLSYDPQVAGTFFLLLAILAFLKLIQPLKRSQVALTSWGVLLALPLLFAGIQRGGIDLLLIAVMIVVAGLLRVNRRSVVALACAIGFIWLPCRVAFDNWIASHDSYHLRTHALGFMTRGWNFETSGEYLPLYEQLDVVSPQPEKKHLLEAILVTEFAKQPVRALLYLPTIKMAKLFAIGFASTADVGLEQGGYSSAAEIYKGLRSVYAPVILALAVYGLLLSFNRQKTLLRLMLPAILIAFSCAGIVLLWETSPRYSHPFHFAILIFASYGVLGLTRTGLRTAQTSIKPILGRNLALVCCWLAFSAALFLTCRMFKSYWLVDPSSLAVTVDQKPLPIAAINPLTKPWEGQFKIPSGTALPATVQISTPGEDGLVLHLWFPNFDQDRYQVDVKDAGVIPLAASGRIARAVIRRSENNKLLLDVRSTDGSRVSSAPVTMDLGFILAK